jgi:hypothetical protein
MVLAPSRAFAQAVWARGGTSTLMSASGFQLDYHWAPVNGWFGLGFGDNVMVGGYLESHYHNYDFGLGDRYQGLNLGSDFFDGGRYFAGRGLFVTRRGEQQTWTAFAGATANEQSYNFVRAFDIQQATAGFFYTRKIGKVTVDSFNIAQDKATSIQSIEYSLFRDLKLSAAGGVGYNSPYFSAGSEYLGNKIQLAASYTSAGKSFRRIGGVTTNAPEHIGSNVRFRYQPFRQFGFSLSHEKMFSPVLKAGDEPLKVSLDSASVFTSVEGFRLSASASTSSSGPTHTRTQNFGVSRDITRGISASATVMRIGLAGGTTNVFIGSLREKISPRLELNQGISRQGNTNSLTFGGRFISNRITIGIQHDMIYSTLAGGFGSSPFMHIWSINLSAHLFRGVTIHTDSIVDPTGKMRYTAWADGVGFSRDHEQFSGGPTQPNPSFSKYVVKGIVQDTDGKPVWGINVEVDGQNAYSDNAGRFFLRFRKNEEYPVSIIPERSLNMQYYEVAQAPVSAWAEPENVAQTIVIVVRKTTNPPPRRRSELDGPEQNLPAAGGSAAVPPTGPSAVPAIGSTAVPTTGSFALPATGSASLPSAGSAAAPPSGSAVLPASSTAAPGFDSPSGGGR